MTKKQRIWTEEDRKIALQWKSRSREDNLKETHRLDNHAVDFYSCLFCKQS